MLRFASDGTGHVLHSDKVRNTENCSYGSDRLGRSDFEIYEPDSLRVKNRLDATKRLMNDDATDFTNNDAVALKTNPPAAAETQPFLSKPKLERFYSEDKINPLYALCQRPCSFVNTEFDFAKLLNSDSNYWTKESHPSRLLSGSGQKARNFSPKCETEKRLAANIESENRPCENRNRHCTKYETENWLANFRTESGLNSNCDPNRKYFRGRPECPAGHTNQHAGCSNQPVEVSYTVRFDPKYTSPGKGWSIFNSKKKVKLE
uniref:Uncharacterized protein n=1 Tax=Cacopsylla melanoneura TaxID=428564 RepID=A0A8D8TU67_9HEMI